CDWRAKSGATKEKIPPTMMTNSKILMIEASAEGNLNWRSFDAMGESTVQTISESTTGKIPCQKLPMISPRRYKKKPMTTKRIAHSDADLIIPPATTVRSTWSPGG